MNVVVITFFCIFIGCIYAEFNIIYNSPNMTMSINTHEFEVAITEEVNQPRFPAYIYIYNAMTKQLVYKTDVSENNSNITYVNKTLLFHIPDSNGWNRDTKYYIALDEGVLYSDNVSNSTAQISSIFRLLNTRVADDNSSVDITTYIPSVITDTGITEIPSSSSSNNVTEVEKTTTTLRALVTGEPSPTRSAQLGMGLGITFIGILLIGEIIYFKYFYHDGQRSGSYGP